MSPQAPKKREKTLKMIFLQSFSVIVAGWLLTTFLSSALWAKNTYIYHTILELTCLFIAISTFFVVWHTYQKSSQVNLLLGFGFLMVAVFDLFHIYYFPGLNLYPPGYYDLSTWYWLAGRLTESVIILITTLRIPHLKVNRWAGLLISLGLPLAISYLILSSQGLLPVLLTQEHGLTPFKIFIEYIIILMFIISLYELRGKINSRDILTYRYIFIALVIAIPAEICFTLYRPTGSFYGCLGHVLKIAYYYYLFKGIFSSAVTYPYIKLEETGRYMADLLNGLPIGITTYDRMSRLNFANKTAEDLFGCEQKEMLGLSVDQIEDKFMKPVAIIPGTAEPITGSSTPLKDRIVTIRNYDGIDVKLSVDVHELANGGCMYLFNEAKKEQELENLKLQTQTILNSSSNAVALYDSRNNLVMCNKALESLMETDTEKLIGMHMDKFNDLIELRLKISTHRKLNGVKSNDPYEISIVTPKGNRKDLILYVDVIYNLDGEIIGKICVGSDITGFKKEQQKTQQQEKLVLLGEMAAGVVHEIRNPLTSIKGFSQLIISKARDEQIREYARIIDCTANDVSKVVSDFLAFAKPRLPVLQELSVNQLIQSMKSALESQLNEKGIKCHYLFTTGEKTVMADGGQIKQAIGIVVNNAIEAMAGSQNPRLTICTAFNELTGEMIITIADNGKGMNPEELLKVGTPFFTTKDYGTGLGMSICYQIVNEHSGRIEIESEPGSGTSVIIYLPCRLPSLRHFSSGSHLFTLSEESVSKIS